MYSQRTTFYPQIDRILDLRAVLEARARFLQSQGYRVNLTQDMGVGAEEDSFAFHALVLVDSLDAWERYRTDTGESGIKLLSDIAPFVRRPHCGSLSEILVPAPRAVAPANYILRLVWTPLVGRGSHLVPLMAEWTRVRAEQGYRPSLALQRTGGDPTALIVNVAFERMAELEELFARGANDAATQQYLAAVSSMVAGPARAEVLRTVIEIPAA